MQETSNMHEEYAMLEMTSLLHRRARQEAAEQRARKDAFAYSFFGPVMLCEDVLISEDVLLYSLGIPQNSSY